MKVTIDFSDFYVEENNIASALKHEIISEAVSKIKSEMRTQIDGLITNEIRSAIDIVLQPVIKEHVASLMSTGMIKVGSYDKKEVTIEEYIKDMFQRNNGWSANANDTIKALAGAFSKQMKERYDLVFASQIVSKMQEQGFLKEDVAEKLLPKG